jgi:hypothetical protein
VGSQNKGQIFKEVEDSQERISNQLNVDFRGAKCRKINSCLQLFVLSLINQSVRFDNGLFGKDLAACANDVTNSFSTKAKI